MGDADLVAGGGTVPGPRGTAARQEGLAVSGPPPATPDDLLRRCTAGELAIDGLAALAAPPDEPDAHTEPQQHQPDRGADRQEPRAAGRRPAARREQDGLGHAAHGQAPPRARGGGRGGRGAEGVSEV
jgi:hypothetical protein